MYSKEPAILVKLDEGRWAGSAFITIAVCHASGVKLKGRARA
jgi:hypothetical protein